MAEHRIQSKTVFWEGMDKEKVNKVYAVIIMFFAFGCLIIGGLLSGFSLLSYIFFGMSCFTFTLISLSYRKYKKELGEEEVREFNRR